MSEFLTAAEKAAIHAVASRIHDDTQLEAAKAAFDRHAPLHGIDACIELQFMSEVLNPVPDLLLRARYRAAVQAT
ncbi:MULTISPECIES: hypothetical protein [Burkholderia]|uniref:hypothetical protein n=1 Tax=Burkholderia TaxID=32008 RepID=UPI0014224A97|nr:MULTISPECIES: hypothetical protein [Burkholderia]NIE81830.1 hypothetical protein [Burkholderia sp. Tr-860]NIF64831.1 hypothetical protein [Burkholderia sp. Cy-647]NIF93921.1 hypothetical protein [Burkholderia sp. Ax-1720]